MNSMENIDKICYELQELFFRKFSVLVRVAYTDCNNLGKWFVLERTGLYNHMRLGLYVGTAISFINSFTEIPVGTRIFEDFDDRKLNSYID